MTEPTATVAAEPTTTVDTYLAAYGEPDAPRRAQMVAACWAPDGELIDPPLRASGHTEIADAGGALQQQFAGHRFRRASGVDAHHERVRFAWELVSPAGEVTLTGTDFGELAGDGRLQRITGFFDAPDVA